MKMVKSLLLGSAAALAAVGGAQAADLPVKAKAVEYVKVCSAYGAGYYYIPGTDTCIKIGGYVRFDTYVNAVGTFNPYISSSSAQVLNDRANDYNTRARGMVTLDARTQTEYGTLRSYIAMAMQTNGYASNGGGAGGGNGWAPGVGTNSVDFERAFIQFAGFTAGYTASFFDGGLNYMYTTPYTYSGKWTNLLAYTAQFGNGFSATLSLEDSGFREVEGFTVNAGAPFAPVAGGKSAPDVVANLRVDQAWGSFQLSGALHQSNIALDPLLPPGIVAYTASTDQWGWALGGTLEFKLPMLGAADSFFLTAAYSKGATSYVGLSGTPQGQPGVVGNTDSLLAGGLYRVSDLVYSGIGNNYDQVTAWTVAGQFRHFWTPSLRSALYAGYTSVDEGNSFVGLAAGTGGCALFGASPAGGGVFLGNAAGGVCNGFNSFDMWQVGANTIWSPVKNLDIGAEIMYTKVEGSSPQYTAAAPAAVVGPAAAYGTTWGGSSDIWSGGLRVQRNF